MVDVIAAAKVDLKEGDIVDGIGGFKTYGICENHSIVGSEGLLPMALAMGCRLVKSVKKDHVLTYLDVESDDHSFLNQMKKKQDNLFPIEGIGNELISKNFP